MSRAKFEEWARSKGYDLDKWEEEFESFLTVAAHEGWIAGRESMRDEASAVCQQLAESHKSDAGGECASNNCEFVAGFETSADFVRKIEP